MPIPAGHLIVSYHHQIVGTSQEATCVWAHTDNPSYSGTGGIQQFLFEKWSTRVRTLVSGNWSFTGVSVHASGELGDRTFDYSPPSAVLGAISGDNPPVNVCTLVKKHTALGGRHGNGRCYLPCGSEDSYNGSYVTPAMAGAVATAMTAWLADVDAAGLTAELEHKALGVVGFSQVTSVAVDSLVGSQRRRLGR